MEICATINANWDADFAMNLAAINAKEGIIKLGMYAKQRHNHLIVIYIFKTNANNARMDFN